MLCDGCDACLGLLDAQQTLEARAARRGIPMFAGRPIDQEGRHSHHTARTNTRYYYYCYYLHLIL